MKLSHRVLIFVLMTWPSLAAVTTAAPRNVLPRGVQELLDSDVIPAYMQGDPQWLVTSLSQIVARVTPERVVLINQALSQSNLPSVSELLLDARLSLVLQGRSQVLPKPHPNEILLTIAPVEQAIEESLEFAQSIAVMQDPLPQIDSLKAFEKAFWDAHVLRNRLRTARMLAEYGQAMVREARTLRPKQIPAEQRSLLDTDFAELDSRLVAAGLKLEERSLELRVQRLALAAKICEGDAPIRERLEAAFVGDLDGELLEQFFTANRDYPFQNAMLRAPGTLKDIQSRSQRVRESPGDLVKKGRLLFEGLHWWMRGRYGQGPEGNGMLKSMQALTDPVALFSLYMPVETPKPTDPFDTSQYSIPEIDRRHHHIWQFEYRRINVRQAITSRQRTQSGGEVKHSITKFDRFY